jgi:hypothetical protein
MQVANVSKDLKYIWFKLFITCIWSNIYPVQKGHFIILFMKGNTKIIVIKGLITLMKWMMGHADDGGFVPGT